MNSLSYQHYDDIMLGKATVFPKKEFKLGAAENEKLALSIIKYAIEAYLKWTPEQAFSCFNQEVVKKMYLAIPLKHIEFPPEYDKVYDINYVVAMIYPDEIHLSRRQQILKIYKRVINREKTKIPKGFFEGERGCENACLCLSCAINEKLYFNSTEEAYNFFADRRGLKFIEECNLKNALRDNFESALEFFHMSLPEENQDELIYQWLTFNKKMEYIK